MSIKLDEELIGSNPWWKGGFFHISIKEREIYQEILPYLEKKQIIGIYGLRRTGKSYLIYYLIKKLLETKEPRSILYFSMDDFGQTSLREVITAAENLSGMKAAYVFLDEVQKLDNWAEQVKRLYDLGNCKIFVSGSESLFLRKTSKESLGGRIFEFEVGPLAFGEYLSFRGIKTGALYSKEIREALGHYLLSSGFPELVEEKDLFFIRKYIKEGIIDKAIYRDIPERFEIEDPSILERILNIVVDNPGLLVDKNDLAKTLGVSRGSVSKYLFYMETSFLLRKIHNYSANASTSEKKLKRYYPAFSPLGIGLKTDPEYMGKVAETVCILKSRTKFFWRNPQKDEVDIVLTGPLLPIEVKYRETPSVGGLFKFMQKFRADSGFVITKDLEQKEGQISYIPLWKFLLGSEKARAQR
ncbi:ATP-binding protein [Candidatus Micrarchaeota archaeon]|nr:ATP-binding protein [Candidatus Micrarchaeota archaeon]